MTGHVADHVMGQTRFGHVTFPQSCASEVPESRFVTIGTGRVLRVDINKAGWGR